MFAKAILILIAMGIIGAAAYQTGVKQAQADMEAQKTASYNVGYEAGKKYTELFPATSGMISQAEYDKVVNEYNDVLNQYNNLVNEANARLNAAYQTRQSITCNSYDYGFDSTTTTCY